VGLIPVGAIFNASLKIGQAFGPRQTPRSALPELHVLQ
jgi:hypothetical protein